MNPLRQLWKLIRDDDETPVITKSRIVEREAMMRRAVSQQIIQSSQTKPGPLLGYIQGEGKRRDSA